MKRSYFRILNRYYCYDTVVEKRDSIKDQMQGNVGTSSLQAEVFVSVRITISSHEKMMN